MVELWGSACLVPRAVRNSSATYAADLIPTWACFADYRDKVDSIGPESLPRIRRPSEVWKHLEFRHVRIDSTVKDTVVIYVVPDWDAEEHMEWCIRGTDQLIYVGQFLGYPVNGYRKAGKSG